jgi:hypothetical protein
MSKLVVALTTPLLTAPVAFTLVATTTPPVTIPVAVMLPFTLWLAVNVLAALNCGTLVVSTFSVTLLPLTLLVRPVPAFTEVIVPGKVCPAAKFTGPVKFPVPCTSSVY